MSDERRVVITGIGAVTSIGVGTAAFLDGLRTGRSGARPIPAFDTTGFAYANGCEVADFNPAAYVHTLEPEDLGRATQFSIAATRLALEDAGVSVETLRGQRAFVSVGTTDGESRDLDQLVGAEIAHGYEQLDPGIARRVPAGRLSSAVVRELGLTDVEAITVSTACAAGNYAIGY